MTIIFYFTLGINNSEDIIIIIIIIILWIIIALHKTGCLGSWSPTARPALVQRGITLTSYTGSWMHRRHLVRSRELQFTCHIDRSVVDRKTDRYPPPIRFLLLRLSFAYFFELAWSNYTVVQHELYHFFYIILSFASTLSNCSLFR